MHTATSSLAQCQPSRREPSVVDHFCLYASLWNMVARKTGGDGVRDGVTIAFTRDEIEGAMSAQGIRDDDMRKAISHACDSALLEETADGFHMTSSGLATYHCLLRRI